MATRASNVRVSAGREIDVNIRGTVTRELTAMVQIYREPQIL